MNYLNSNVYNPMSLCAPAGIYLGFYDTCCQPFNYFIDSKKQFDWMQMIFTNIKLEQTENSVTFVKEEIIL